MTEREKSYLLHKSEMCTESQLARGQLDEIANICAHDPYDVHTCVSVSQVC
jgi:hypothetical protein